MAIVLFEQYLDLPASSATNFAAWTGA